jgi:predicted ATP-dependent serine protease
MEKWKCRYCGTASAKYSTICSSCHAKLKQVKQLKKILAEIEKAERKEENA